MKPAFWIPGVGIGISTGLLVAAVPTVLGWRLNPGGILHGAAGTNWSIVADTLSSWFLPVFLVCTPVALLLLYLRNRRR